jgi:hypothetical protein
LSLQTLENSLRLHESLSRHESASFSTTTMADMISNIAVILRDQGEYANAIEKFLLALHLYGPNDIGRADVQAIMKELQNH